MTIDGKDASKLADVNPTGQHGDGHDQQRRLQGADNRRLERDAAPGQVRQDHGLGYERRSGQGQAHDQASITGDAKDFTIPDDAKITVDGKEAKVADVKAGDTATVTTDKEGKIAAVEVEKLRDAASAAPAARGDEDQRQGHLKIKAGNK